MGIVLQFEQVLDAVEIGDVISELSVAGGRGVYAFAFTSNPGNLFALSGNQVGVSQVLSIGETSITISANNGLDPAVLMVFTYNVISVAPSWRPGQRPFSITSAANLPILEGTVYTPLAWMPTSGGNYFAGIKFGLDIPGPSITNVCDVTSLGGWGNPAATFPRIMTPGFTGAADGSDHEAISLIATDCMSFYELDRTSDAAANAELRAFCDVLKDTGFGNAATGQGAGVVATGSSCLLGALLKEEFTAGEINHWVSFCMLDTFLNFNFYAYNNFYPPAISGDGGSSNGLFAEGQLMAIPPGVAMPAGLSGYGQKLFRALQNYGAWCNDKGGTTFAYCAAVYDQNQPNGRAATSWTDTDIGFLISDTKILWPMLWKTGCPLDGLLTVTLTYATCGPQTQLISYVNPLMRIARDSDSALADISSAGPPSYFLDTAKVASFCSGTVGRVTTYRNQIVHSSFDSSGGAAPIIYQSGAFKNINGIPALLFDGSSNYFVGTGTSSQWPAASVYMNAVILPTDFAGNYAIFGSNVSGGLELRLNATTGLLQLMTNTGTVIGAATVKPSLGGPLVVEALYLAGASYKLWINGALLASGTTAVTAATGDMMVGSGGPGGTDLFKGLIGTWTVAVLIPSNPQFSINQGLIDYWGPVQGLIVAKDTFIDTNGTDIASHTMDVGAGWTEQIGTFNIQSNAAQPNTMGSHGTQTLALATFSGSAVGTIKCDLTSFKSGASESQPFIVIGYSSINGYLAVGIVGTTVGLYFENFGNDQLLAMSPTAVTPGTPSTIEVTMTISTVTFTVDGGPPTVLNESLSTVMGLRAISVGSPAGKCSFDNLLVTIP